MKLLRPAILNLRTLVVLSIAVVALLAAVLVLLFVADARMDTGALTEIIAGLVLFAIVLSAIVPLRGVHQARTLTSAFRRVRSGGRVDLEGPLGDAISEHTAHLRRTIVLEGERIGVQSLLIGTLVRRAEEWIVVVAGDGSPLYRSPAVKDLPLDAGKRVASSPSIHHVARRVLDGDSPGTVVVGGKERHCVAIVGRTIASIGESGGMTPRDVVSYLILTDYRDQADAPVLGRDRAGVARKPASRRMTGIGGAIRHFLGAKKGSRTTKER